MMLRRAPNRCLLNRAFIARRSPRRHFFGVGELLGVVTNPAETIKQLNESKELLQKAREDMALKKEKQRIPRKHTFSKLPGFHGRKAEQILLRKILTKTPQMTVIFGGTSVGKTALLRQVLATDDFFVIKFDLRVSGFADLRTMYISLCEQFQNLFDEMNVEEMDKQKLTYKHLILELDEKESAGNYEVSVADIANLMESFQSSLLRYWQYEPKSERDKEEGEEGKQDDRKEDDEDEKPERLEKRSTSLPATKESKGEKTAKYDKEFRKRPLVFLIDEAHKLPALVSDQLSLKVFLDTLLVLTKQDRLCHVLLATSDPFFQHFLRSMNVGHHAQLMTIGDCTHDETYAFFMDELIESVPGDLRPQVDFEGMYTAFGGKLSHLSDYLAGWINCNGDITPYNSAIFTQAYTLLQFHLTHEGFQTFSPLSTAIVGAKDDDKTDFTRKDLLFVMRKLVEPPYSYPYFDLCRSIGTDKADAMVKTRVLDLRWTKTVTPEQNWAERKWSEDGIERPIVLPMTRIMRRAMEIVLAEEDAREAAQQPS